MSAGRNKRAEEEEEERGGVEEEEEDFEEAMKRAASSSTSRRKPSKQPTIQKIPEVVDDFLRNFLQRAGLSRTLSRFEAEWYGSEALKAAASRDVQVIPHALAHRQQLQTELEATRRKTDLLRQEVLLAGEDLLKMQRERDFHRLQYRRVAEDKNRLIEDFKQLKRHLESYEPALRRLEEKHQAALRQKMLISLKKDKVQNSTEVRQNLDKPQTKRDGSRSEGNTSSQPKDSEFPVCGRRGQVRSERRTSPASLSPASLSPASLSLASSITAHQLPVSCIDLHPKKLILASASDDRSWRLWTLTGREKVGQMMQTGEGHSDWLSGCSFHPDGAKLATTSGDCTVRLWDFSLGSCVLTLSGHSRPTWSCSFHSCGHFLSSCSADTTAKLWDLNSERCRLTLRRHAASVNSVCFLPLSDLLLTCSADRTIALWDARLGVCTAAFHGHRAPCNHAAFGPTGDVLASCDSGGVVNLWDVRKPAFPTAAVDAGPLGANQVAFSPSGKTLAVAGADGLVRVVQVESGVVSSLSGHRDGVQSVTFDHQGETVMSAGSDGVINVWA